MFGSILKFWLAAFALMLHAPLQASAAATSYRWNDRVSIYEAYWDDPRPLLAEAERLLPLIDPQQEPLRWLQVFCGYGMSNDAIHQMPRLQDHLRTAKNIAQSLGLWEYEIDIGIIEGAYVESLTPTSPADIIDAYGLDVGVPYERALRIADDHRSLRDHYLVARNYMSYLRSHGQTSRILELFENASDDLNLGQGLHPIDRLHLKKNMIFLYRLADREEGIFHFTEELAQDCQKLELATFCAYVLYDYGFMLSMSAIYHDYPRAYPVLFRAETLAKGLGDDAMLGMIYLAAAQLSSKLNKLDESMHFAERSEFHARFVGAYATLGLAVLTWADNLRMMKRYQEAIDRIENLRQELPKNQFELQSRISKQLADIHTETGAWKLALEERNRQITWEKTYNAERGQELFTRQTARLGLQLEQEKNKALRTQNELQERKLHHAEFERRAIILAIVAVLMIALSLLLGLLWVSRKNREIGKLQSFIETQVLQRFLPPRIVGDILAGKSHFEQKAQARLVTVLFADLVNFTESAERMNPQDLTELLNGFFAAMSEVVFEHGGVIDKFIGDAIMVVFGAPQDLAPDQQASCATQCAQQLLVCLEHLNQDWEPRFGIRFSMRVGIHQGPGVVGTFGSRRRSDYTVIGHTVNLASRIEGKAMPDQILVSESVAAHLPGEKTSCIGSFRLKGIEHPVALFTVNAAVDRNETPPLAV